MPVRGTSGAMARYQVIYSECTMRMTINLDDTLVAQAQRLTGTTERTALIHEALRALIARESARRLARLGGSEPQLTFSRRRKAS